MPWRIGRNPCKKLWRWPNLTNGAKEQLILRLQGELKTPLDNAIITLQNLLVSEESRLNAAQKGVLRSAQAEMKRVGSIIANYHPGPQK